MFFSCIGGERRYCHFVEEVDRAETKVVNVRWSGVACNVVPCGLVERREERSARGVGVHGRLLLSVIW